MRETLSPPVAQAIHLVAQELLNEEDIQGYARKEFNG
jgi:hypothetical protein